ncbi:P-loop NTPase fold protein [Mesorhizobium sp. B2-8-5]|uniref:P-loop NTPase fold protein n=1 Tax=Mesorhizobium sp. B2-8-5 TaxID=2589903 RepID=UPI00112BF62C|nr:P-loop NTPase fold protein [Mesorhizobium sp. B2-8-5]UCI28475.1 KAP family NTPase [Mesorhizobium sp. B2-8-5]
MVDGINIRSRGGLERWLAGEPSIWAQAIAARLALRVLPLAAFGSPTPSSPDRLALAMFRAAFVSWAAGSYPEHDVRLAAEDAARVVTATLDIMGTSASTAAAARIVVQAAVTNAVTDDTALFSLAAAADLATDVGDATQLWTSISADVSYLSEARSQDRAGIARRLMHEPLWLTDVRGDPKFQANFPRWARTPFDRMTKDTTLIETGFRHWIAWYRAILPNGRTVRPTSYFGEKLDVRIAGQPDTWWSREPRKVNEDIARWSAGRISENSADTYSGPHVPPAEILESISQSGEIAGDKRNSNSEGTEDSPRQRPLSLPETSAIDTNFLDDSADPDVDFLSRADLAFVLAGRLNQIWDQLNKIQPQENYAGNSARWTGLWPQRPSREPPPGFVVHIDAPWGGGKTCFANFLIRLLNPYKVAGSPPDWMLGLPLGDPTFWPESYRRPWHIVTFNAWQHQHVLPPWWVFYQAIRKQTTDAIFAERALVEPASATDLLGNPLPDAPQVPQPPAAGQGYLSSWLRTADWSWSWLREMFWRVWTPDIRNKVAITVLGIAAVGLFFQFGLLKLNDKGAVDPNTSSLYPFISVVIAALVGGAPLIWTVLSALSSTLLSGTPDAAKNYALGSGDPLDRFRAHFARMMASLKRPVLVVIDDLDRCEPTFVVELIRGMQTILKSPRLVFILLGDRDWIEECFTKVNEAMKGIHVGPEHEFGARFAEKAIQFSFVLPDISDSARRTYVRDLLGIKRPPTQELEFEAASPMDSALQRRVEAILRQDQALERESAAQAVREDIKTSAATDAAARVVLTDLDRRLSLRAATDKTAEAATRHWLEALSSVLPPNPRQIKRIINAVALLQEVARIEQGVQPGSTEWKILALWIILMIEWPKSWFTLSTYPGLANRLLNRPDEAVTYLPVENTNAFLRALRAKVEVMAIIKFQGDQEWQDCAITTAHILKLRQILPPASGQLIEVAPPKKPAPTEES